jgi:hypothetical protein
MRLAPSLNLGITLRFEAIKRGLERIARQGRCIELAPERQQPGIRVGGTGNDRNSGQGRSRETGQEQRSA